MKTRENNPHTNPETTPSAPLPQLIREIAARANQAIEAGDNRTALAAMRRLCCAMPDNDGVSRRLTALLDGTDAQASAANWALRCLALGGPVREDLLPAAQILIAAGRSPKAEPVLDELLRASPGDPDLLEQRALCGEDWRPVGESLRRYVRVVCLDPTRAGASARLALMLQARSRWVDAAAWSRRSLVLAPGDAKLVADNAHLLLRQDPLAADSWRAYRTRWRTQPVAESPLPPWDGARRDGQRLLVWGEQGIGDQIMMSGFLASETLAGGNHCLLVNPRLVALFQRSLPNWRVVGSMAEVGRLDCTHQIPIGDLGAILPDTSFRLRLTADPSRISAFRAAYADGERPCVGISWNAGARPDDVARRSLPWPVLDALTGHPEVRFVSLQYGAPESDLAALSARGIIVDPDIDPYGDMDVIAAQIASLDAVVTVGNTVGHMAGALGVPTLCLLAKVASWRWGVTGADCPWYPAMKLARQETPGDWTTVAADADAWLRSWAWDGRES